MFEANLRLAEAETKPGSTPTPEAADQPEAPPERTLMLQFESLGGSGHGCEFGLAQQHYGAEPLDLLRWSDLGDGCDGLIQALECRLDGIGAPDNTILETVPSDGRKEYWTKDRRYWMAMRAFIFEDEVPYDKMWGAACRRLRILRDKLIKNLTNGDKIFVYRNMWRNLRSDELGRLYAATRAFGPNWLLIIQFADDIHPAGSAEVRAPGLIVGYIDHFGFSPGNEPLGDVCPDILTVCGAAHALWTQQRGSAA